MIYQEYEPMSNFCIVSTDLQNNVLANILFITVDIENYTVFSKHKSQCKKKQFKET